MLQHSVFSIVDPTPIWNVLRDEKDGRYLIPYVIVTMDDIEGNVTCVKFVQRPPRHTTEDHLYIYDSGYGGCSVENDGRVATDDRGLTASS